MLAHIASFVYANRRRVLITAAIATVVAGAFGVGVTRHMSPYGATDPATQSVRATERFETATGRKLDPGIVAIVRVGDVGGLAAERRVAHVTGELRAQPDVASAVSFYDTHDPSMVSHDRRSTYVVAYFKRRSDRRLEDSANRIETRFAGQRYVQLGGEQIADAQANTQVGADLARAELLAFPVIFLLSLLFFRSLVAALLPPLIGVAAILMTFFALRLVSSVVDLSVFALNFVTGLGLGLAIDYSLFMVSRYREEAATSGFGPLALQRTLQTAGRTITFSAITVAAAVASLAIFPQRFLSSMGIAGALVALIAAALALVVLPAVLAVLGPRVNALAPARLQRSADRDARPEQSGAWYRLAHFVTRRPGRVAALSATLLIALATPLVGIKFISVTASVLPTSTSARQVDDALARDFPPNHTSPVEVIVDATATSPQVARLASKIASLPDLSAIAPAQRAGAHTTLLRVTSVQPPLSDATKRLVRTIRSLHGMPAFGVAGQTAALLDLEHSLGAHLPAVAGLIIAATLLVLFLFTGSVVLPLKAVLMNILSLSAVLGVLVLIFQDGRLEGPLAYTSQKALDATQLIFVAAVAFGLATDYGVFLLSRIKEAHDNGAPDREAVAIGLERTGRIVTAAALLFAVAIGAFATSQLVFIKELGLGTALAVLIDATIIRALLVPSLMGLLGARNWWAPAPLRRLHDRIGQAEQGRRPAARLYEEPQRS